MAKKKTFSFAHLIGRGATASEEEEDKKAKKAKSRRAEEDEREDDAGDDEREDDAEDDERDDNAEDDGDDPEASEDDDDSEDDGDEDRKESKAVKNARAAERKRCARIFGSKHAAANPSLAASLAFNTGMSSSAAIDVLASTAPASQPQATRGRSLDQRMQESHDVRLGLDGGKPASGKSALVSKMTSLYNSTKGEK
ncbi:TPA: hypothetical protein ACTYTR_004378 [Klebsiella michiganensis]|uniref:hypothetical protein n=1 Tax=Klebsiella michiganensis TaxID=1134687 RepID=UPI0009B6764E|nr:hypothetical protein [Klebsiella michiganensis]ARB24676.1 hypothetical protein AM394_27320 [Klebsiella oxytoca]MDM4122166.1 hypothetical protein [Klebsiella michiganensis]MDM4159054.1 hypothetical protein [Klebsiella michiganensis]MDS7757286.1 hypothetical protein [Klebsiella michiganensis]QUG44988.1 hypothetical protein KDU73_21370 [Klebsiella michiganensis]